jgi:atypical dual specificity phosphatase
VLSNFSYLIEGVLAGCAHPASFGQTHESLCELHANGIRAIVSLDEEGLPLHLLAEYGFQYLHLPMPDFGVPTLEQACNFVRFVRRQRALGNPVVVHCRAGFGRTGTMLAVFLVSEGVSPEDAIRRVRQLRPGSIETSEQEAFIHQFASHLPTLDLGDTTSPQQE